MTLTIKEIELIYFGASIAAGCKPCTSFHFTKVKEAGASDEEIKSALTDAVNIRDIAKKEMENLAMSLLSLSTQSEVSLDNLHPDRLTILVSIGAAFAMNCTSTLKNYIALGESVGITNEEINKIFRAVKLVKMKAASHVDNIAARFEEAKTNIREEKSDGCGCTETKNNVQTESNEAEPKFENGCC